MPTNPEWNLFGFCYGATVRVCIIAKKWVESIWQLGWCAASAQTQQLYNHIEASEKVSISGLAALPMPFWSLLSLNNVQSISYGCLKIKKSSVYAQRSRAIVAKPSSAVLSC